MLLDAGLGVTLLDVRLSLMYGHFAATVPCRLCSMAVPLDAATDFSSLSAKALKTLVTQHDVACDSPMEKSDYVACLQRHVEQQQRAAAGHQEL
eukprot:365323-Chlamydomonas_euryale.AAC.9